MGFPSNWEACREAPGPGPPLADTPRPASSAGSHAQAPPPPRAADVSGPLAVSLARLATSARNRTVVAGTWLYSCSVPSGEGGARAPRAQPPPHAAPRSLGRRVPGRAPVRPPAAQRAEGPGATTLLPAFVPGALGARPAAEPPRFCQARGSKGTSARLTWPKAAPTHSGILELP